MTPTRYLPLVALLVPFVVAAAPKASAQLVDTKGNPVGTARLIEVGGAVQMSLQVAGLPPGKHGIHVHAVGKCETPDFKSAGGHFNPMNKKHGLRNPAGHHAGDLPNIKINDQGKATARVKLRGVTLGEGLSSLVSGDGTAIVIHAAPDDEKTDPAGNSGDRIACGVIQPK